MAERHPEAVKVHEDAREMRAWVYGEDHTDVAISLQQKALSLLELERYEETNASLQKSLDIRKRVSNDQMLISNTHLAIGKAYQRQAVKEEQAVEAYK